MNMIWLWGYKTLRHNIASTLASICGISVSFFLALFFAAVWSGETKQIVAYPKSLDADLWVMQDGVNNMHMASSYLWDWKADAIRKIKGVARVTGFVYVNTSVKINQAKLFAFVVGLETGDSTAANVHLVAGRKILAEDEIILPSQTQSLYGVSLHDRVQVIDQDYKVVGFSAGLYSSANPVFFVLKPRLQKSLSADGTLSYLIVKTGNSDEVNQVKDRILSNVDNLNVLTNDEFIENDRDMASQMGADTILIMMLICSALSTILIGFSSYSMVDRKRKEIAIIKAIGGTQRLLSVVLLVQALVIALFGYFIAVVLLLILSFILPIVAPQIILALSYDLLVTPLPYVLGIALLGASYPMIKILKLDPALAYASN